MSIASEIQRLSGVRSDIFTSITNKGVTVPQTATFSSCPSLIDSITGGGGSPTSLINNTFTASGYLSAYRPFTATQNEVPVYDDITYTGTVSNNNNTFTLPNYKTTADSPQTATFTVFIQSYAYPSVYQGNIVNQGVGTSIGRWSANQQSQTEYSIIFDISAYPINSNTFQCDDMSQWAWGITSVSPYTATYREQTGTDIPYPTYPTTTTGYAENTIDLKERWDNNGNNYNALLSSNNTLNIVYDNSPSNTSINSTNTANVSTFSSNMLKNKWGLDVSPIDTNYNYNYGTLTSGYSGFEGI